MRISKPCGQNQRNAEPDADLGTVRTKPNPKNVVRNRCADKNPADSHSNGQSYFAATVRKPHVSQQYVTPCNTHCFDFPLRKNLAYANVVPF